MLQLWQSIDLWKRVLIGLAIGLIVGVVLHYIFPDLPDVPIAEAGEEVNPPEPSAVPFSENFTGAAFADHWIYPIGDAFVRLIKMLVVPLIATTLVAGSRRWAIPKKLGSLGARTLAMYLLTTFFAVSLAWRWVL